MKPKDKAKPAPDREADKTNARPETEPIQDTSHVDSLRAAGWI